MIIVKDREFGKGEIVPMDGYYYINCKGDGCILLFGGGDFGWQSTLWLNCQITFAGPAKCTLEFLGYFGLKPQKIEQPETPPQRVN